MTTELTATIEGVSYYVILLLDGTDVVSATALIPNACPSTALTRVYEMDEVFRVDAWEIWPEELYNLTGDWSV